MSPLPPPPSNVGKTTIDLIQILNNYQHCVWGEGNFVHNRSKCQFVYKFFSMIVAWGRGVFHLLPPPPNYSFLFKVRKLCISQFQVRTSPPGNPQGFAPIFISGHRDLCRLDCPGVGPIIKVPSCQLMLHEGTFQLQTDLPSVDAL